MSTDNAPLCASCGKELRPTWVPKSLCPECEDAVRRRDDSRGTNEKLNTRPAQEV